MEDTQTKKYIQTVGRRKQAVAQVRLYPAGKGEVVVNTKKLEDFFPVQTLQQSVNAPFAATGTESQFDVTVQVKGGGITGQAESVRMGIARALVEHNPELRTTLKKLGFLKRDARVKERKKYGKRGARRSPQWSKR